MECCGNRLELRIERCIILRPEPLNNIPSRVGKTQDSRKWHTQQHAASLGTPEVSQASSNFGNDALTIYTTIL
jgi:hypothetical protein